MRRFRFRFQRVLGVKQRLEDARKAALGEAQAALNREHQLLVQLVRTRKQYLDAARGQTAAVLDPSLLSLNANYVQRLEEEAGQQRQHLLQVEAIVADQRAKLVEARRQRRIFEILKEKAWVAHQRQVRRQEQFQLDEAGERLYARRETVATQCVEREKEYARED